MWRLFNVLENTQSHLFIEPASHHNWDIEVSFNSMIPLPKTVYFARASGALQRGGKKGGQGAWAGRAAGNVRSESKAG